MVSSNINSVFVSSIKSSQVSILMIIMIMISCYSRPCSSTEPINEVCHQTEDFELCYTIYREHQYTPGMNFEQLCQISVTQALIQATSTKIFVMRAKNNAASSTLKHLLTICEDAYASLINQFEYANLAFTKGDYKAMLLSEEPCPRMVRGCMTAVGKQVAGLDDLNSQMNTLVRMAQVSGGLIGS